MISEIAKRYATAIYETAKAHKTIDSTGQQLEQLSLALSQNPELKNFIASPILTATEKRQALAKVFPSAQDSDLLSLLGLMIDKNRIELIAEVAQAFSSLSDESRGLTRGTVRSATPINEDHRRKLEATISKTINKQLVMKYTEDSSIIGGVVAEVGGWTFDDSLKTHLKRMKEDLNRRS